MKKRRFTIIAIIIILLISLAASFAVLTSNLAPVNTSALFGGKLEDGYPYAGYLIAFENDNKVTTCGVTYLSQNIAISSAHCIPNNSSIYVGTNQFRLQSSDNVSVSDATINPGWVGKPLKDISILKTSRAVTLGQYAQIVSPQIGCNYEVVAYGRNETSIPGDLSSKLRKSSEICIQDILQGEALIQGNGGGICFGDSGSPVFEKGTNRIVGIISSIVSSAPNDNNLCNINNRAAMVTLDSNQDFINSYKSVSSANGLPKCGESCKNGSCESGLICSNNNFCIDQSSKCIATENNFCSFVSNIGCASGMSCNANKCVVNTNAAAEIQTQDSTQSVSLLENITPENRTILILIVLTSLGVIGILVFILNKKDPKRR